MEATSEEDPAGGLQDLGPCALLALAPTQANRSLLYWRLKKSGFHGIPNTDGIYILMESNRQVLLA